MENEDKILETLKQFGRMPSGRLAAISGMNYDSFILTIQKLLQKEAVIKEEETNATYWRLNDGV